jgi:hypothetical protein
MTPLTVPTEAAILGRVIEPDRGNWSRAAAQSILGFRFPAADVERMNALAAKARAGEITPEDQEELETSMRVG